MGLFRSFVDVDTAAATIAAPARGSASCYSPIIRSDQAELLTQTMAKQACAAKRTQLNHIRQKVGGRKERRLFPNRMFQVTKVEICDVPVEQATRHV
jgi:hypothetical protein